MFTAKKFLMVSIVIDGDKARPPKKTNIGIVDAKILLTRAINVGDHRCGAPSGQLVQTKERISDGLRFRERETRSHHWCFSSLKEFNQAMGMTFLMCDYLYSTPFMPV
ncbi:MAG: hypothetical protein ACM34A_08535 [Bacillota bacterium]